MNTACIIEARMRSSRLPGKVLRPIVGKPMLELLVERLRRARGVDQVIVATTDDASCDEIARLAERLGVGCFRGSEDDVLDRVLQAAKAHGVDVIVETTGDNPLLDAGTIERALDAYRQGDVDYVSNVLEPTYPRGVSVQVFSTKLLEEVARVGLEQRHREHVSLYIYEEPGRYRLRNVPSGLPASAAQIRVTVDTPEDFELVSRVFEALYPTNPAFGLDDLMAYFDGHPELLALNAHVRQKAVQPAESA
jgi:spore coat polysaccharide biosynthesis protein SpsF